MKPDEVLSCRFLFACLALSVHKTIVVYTVWLRNSCIVYERKTKDCARSCTFQPKSWDLCLLL